MSTYHRSMDQLATRLALRRPLRLLAASAFALSAVGVGLATITSSPAGADSALGGFTVVATGSGETVSYEQPNFPLPATPSAELDVGYTTSSDNFGPTGGALASSLYPGQVVANAGPELGSFEPGVPLPAAPVWPVQATTTCPTGPNSSLDPTPTVSMDADCTSNAVTATATFGSPNSTTVTPASAGDTTTSTTAPSAGGLPTIPSLNLTNSSTPSTSASVVGNGFFSMQGLSSTSSSSATDSAATATSSASASGISLLGGIIKVGSVTSTATATSNGTTGKVSGTSAAQQVVIAGEPVTVDSSGVHAAGNTGPISSLLPTAQQLLSTAGITMTLTNPTDTTKEAQVSRQLDGLRIEINLTTLDKAAGPLSAVIPESVLAELPVPLPNEQILVLDIGWVSVKSGASPAYVAGPLGASSGGSTGNSGSGSTPGTSGTTGNTGSGDFSGVGDDSGTAGTSGTPGSGPTGGVGSNSLNSTPASVASPLFKGIGGGLIALGLLAAAGIGFAYLRAQTALESVGAGAACATGGPGGAGGGDPLSDDLFGGDPLYSGIDSSITGI